MCPLPKLMETFNLLIMRFRFVVLICFIVEVLVNLDPNYYWANIPKFTFKQGCPCLQWTKLWVFPSEY